MGYSAVNTQAIQIEHIAPEVTIVLHPVNPYLTIKPPSFISGVYDVDGNKNPRLPMCNIDNDKSTILDNIKTISATDGGEITIQLKTEYNEITGP